jgi:outer membrane autotransporter protein
MRQFEVRHFGATLPIALLMTTALVKPSLAACVSSADFVTLNCSGTLAISAGLPITIYDAAAAYQPTNGGNAYTPANPAFPAATNPANPGYDPNPPTVTLNFDSSTVANVVNPAAGSLTDRALIVANFSNIQNPAVNNVVINNAGAIGLTTNQIASRMDVIVADSQVNSFTVNNSGTISATQTFFSAFSASKLANTASGTPATLTARYNGATLNDIAAFYSDDNTAAFVLNNLAGGQILATGNFATGYYGRADTTIENSGTIAHTNWTQTDTIAAGHWAIAAWGGTEYTAAPNTNPDSTIVLPNADGSVTVQETSALTVTNNTGATIKGDILALDITPLVYAAAVGSSTNPFPNPGQTDVLQLPVASSNAGPRDSNIQNFGAISGNLYLGSGTHVIDNASGATLQGNVYVDQRPFQVVFSVPTPGSESGTYLSAGGADFNGNACPAAGSNTTNSGCATTQKQLATVVGGQSLTLSNEGTFTGDIRIFDQPTSVNEITLTGAGFNGNIVAINGTGSNSLVLDGVTNLASVNNFSSINLNTSRVTVVSNASTLTPGVTLTPNATLATTIAGTGGTAAAPSTNLGSINGQLTLGGATTIVPTFAAIVRNGDVYQLASAISGDVSDISVVNQGALVTLTANTGAGGLLLNASVVNANQIPGISKPAAATLNSLLSFAGSSAKVQALGVAVESLPTLAAARTAAEQLSPSVNGASIQMPLAINNLFASQIFNRMDASIYGALQAPGTGPRDFIGSAAPIYKGPFADNQDEGVWLNVVGSNISQQAMSNIAGYESNMAGFIAGLDRAFAPGLRFGGAIGYATGSAKNDGRAGDSLNLQTVEGMVYGSLIQPNWYLKGTIGVASLNYQSARTIAFTGVYDYATASRDGLLYSAGLDAGRPFVTTLGAFIPVASLIYAHVDQDGYQEKSYSGAGLNVASQQTNSLQSGLGMKTVLPFNVTPAMASAVELRAVWRHEFLDTAESLTAAFVGGGSFQAVGPQPTRDLADVGAALRFGFPNRQQNFEVSYNARLGANYTEQVGMFRARYDF